MPRVRSIVRILVAAAVGAVPLLVAAPAWAWVDGPCDGSVTIGGTTYTPANDTTDDPIPVPKTGTATWEGSTDFPIHHHNGSVGVTIGPIVIEVASWANPNKGDEVTKKGSYDLSRVSTAMQNFGVDPVGMWGVEGFHEGDEDFCEGAVVIDFAGSPFDGWLGFATVGLSALSVLGVALSSFVRTKVPLG